MIEQRPLGHDGPEIGRLGYGAMVLEGFYGPAEEKASLAALHKALECGLTMIDTADAYGAGNNETLISRAIRGRRHDAFIATKFGVVFDPKESGRPLTTNWAFSLNINATPEYARRALDASLTRLNADHIDLWYAHYPDPDVAIEETVGAMADAVSAGKVRYLGLSNVTAEQVRRAHKVHPISAVQYEYSLWRREAESELLPTLRELGIALVGWSPLGGGFLAGDVEIGKDDRRRANPRYSTENLAANRDRFAPFMAIAAKLGISPAQLALAWLLHKGDDIFPIPGTRKSARIVENAAAAAVRLEPALIQHIDEIAQPGLAVGASLL